MKSASCFAFTGTGRISIARFPPRGTPGGFRGCRRLAPGPWFKSFDEARYRRRCAAQLASRDPRRPRDLLQEFAGRDEPALL